MDVDSGSPSACRSTAPGSADAVYLGKGTDASPTHKVSGTMVRPHPTALSALADTVSSRLVPVYDPVRIYVVRFLRLGAAPT